MMDIHNRQIQKRFYYFNAQRAAAMVIVFWRWQHFFSRELALLATARGALGKRVSILGDISYSTYLLHLPLQLLFNIAAQTGVDISIFYSKITLIIFFGLLIIASFTSFHYYERPV